MLWTVLFLTTCGPLNFLNDAPACWRDTGHQFRQLAECIDFIEKPPAPGQFKCAASDLPDADKTPGSANPVLTKSVFCAKDFTTRKYRHISSQLRADVFSSYGIFDCHFPVVCGKVYELDHLIPLEIGGSNDQTNLWPQPRATHPWNAIIKDRLEDKLHSLVCDGKVSLKQAQDDIAKDWIAAYKKYMPKGKTK
jgi:hypothetical protein